MRLAALLLLLAAPCQEGAGVTGKVVAPEGEIQKRLRTKIRYSGPGADKRKAPDPSPAVVWLEGLPAAKVEGKTVEMRQEGLEFRPRVLAVTAGTTVRFPNGDDLYHNVFSYSPAKKFDLGKYAKDESKEVTFDRKGRVEVSCEVHEHMRGYVLVMENRYFAVVREDGTYAIPNVPPGTYTLAAWKEFFDPIRREVEVKAGGTRVDLQLSFVEKRPSDRSVSAGCCEAR